MPVFHAGFDPAGQVVRVRFERGARRDLGQEMDALGVSRALILTTPQQVAQGQEIVQSLGDRAAGLFSGAAMHTPVEVTQEAMAEIRASRADCTIAIGGGSTIGLGKAIAYRTDLPQIVLPTTYAGSEATPVLGQTENGVKTTLKSPKVQPEVIVYDADLVATLPVDMTVTSALNAMAHAVEGLYARDANRLSSTLALQGIRAFAVGLSRVIAAPADVAAREETLFGAWLCGTVLAQVGMALHHKLCHTLGGALNLPHAETHAIVLPHATAFNEFVAGDRLRPVADLLGSDTAGGGLFDLAEKLGAPLALKSLGVSESDLDRVAELAVQNSYWNPRAIERDAVRALLQDAYEGKRP
ncbi:maleylacetate reductase [Chelativorans alearense]|uniref:maleylacetate reductase n=1 Tax=Chelativorans alearense TaxID=2681495 RepID=UPI0013D84E71|nr:maleylacetate reductase [Chelativorans alearense]